jgi:hypothetical protein
VHALAGQRVEVDRQRRHQRLALAGAHLGDLAVVQHHAADELDVEVPHAAARACAASRTTAKASGSRSARVAP